MHQRTPTTRIIGLLAATAMIAASCGGDDDDADDTTEPAATDDSDVDPDDDGATSGEGAGESAGAIDELVIAIGGDETSLNPYTYVTGYPGWNLLGLIHDSLLVLDETNTPQPLLATDWTTSDDGLVWTMSLRDDVA